MVASILINILSHKQCIAQSTVRGIWDRGGSPDMATGVIGGVGLQCIQRWVCSLPPGIWPSNTIAVTRPARQVTRGMCFQQGGPIDSCQSCTASEPNVRCEYFVPGASCPDGTYGPACGQ